MGFQSRKIFRFVYIFYSKKILDENNTCLAIFLNSDNFTYGFFQLGQKNTGLLKLFSDTQLYLYGLFAIHQQIREWLINENKSLNLSVLGNLMYSIHIGQEVNVQLLHLIPELTRLGFLHNDINNNKTVTIPNT